MNVLQTITTLDTELARILEPFAPRPDLRVESVRKLASAGLAVTVMNSPVLPLSTIRERASRLLRLRQKMPERATLLRIRCF